MVELISESSYSKTLEDGSINVLSLWNTEPGSSKVFVVLPAMGVRASYYAGFCEKMATHGCAVASIDWRGHGQSSIIAGRRQDWGYARLVQEIQYWVTWLRQSHNFEQVFIIGHSMGGQVGHLVAA